MVTHYIYEIPGVKVGCTKSMEFRPEIERLFNQSLVDYSSARILEELHDKSDREAGDIEWSWADRLNYPRGEHYLKALNALRAARSKCKSMGRGFYDKKLQQELIDNGSKSKAAKLKSMACKRNGTGIYKAGFFEDLNRENREKSKGIFNPALIQEVHTCPKCGTSGRGPSMKRWHFDRCTFK